jgi:hypothetical protein
MAAKDRLRAFHLQTQTQVARTTCCLPDNFSSKVIELAVAARFSIKATLSADVAQRYVLAAAPEAR